MRQEEQAFDGGDFYILSHTESSIAFAREKMGSRVIVIANMGDGFMLPLDRDVEYRNIETGEVVSSAVYVKESSVLLLKQTR